MDNRIGNQRLAQVRPAPKTSFPPSMNTFCAPKVSPKPELLLTIPTPPPKTNRVPDSESPPSLTRPHPKPGDTNGTIWTPVGEPIAIESGALAEADQAVPSLGFANPMRPLNPSTNVAFPACD